MPFTITYIHLLVLNGLPYIHLTLPSLFYVEGGGGGPSENPPKSQGHRKRLQKSNKTICVNVGTREFNNNYTVQIKTSL